MINSATVISHPLQPEPERGVAAFMSRPVDISIIIVNYNTEHLLQRLFASLRAAQAGLSLQIIVVDNASTDSSAETLRTFSNEIQLCCNRENVGFGRANNQALSLAQGEFVLLLNTDAFIAPDALVRTVEFMRNHPRYGILGVRLVDEFGQLQPSCRYFPTPWNEFLATTGVSRWFPKATLVDDLSWDHSSVRSCDWVPGCFYLVRRAVVDHVGLFDPRFFLYYEEVDHCRMTRAAGWEVAFFPATHAIHIGGESSRDNPELGMFRQVSPLQAESQLLYFRKHYGATGVVAALALGFAASAVRMLSRTGRKHPGIVVRREIAATKTAVRAAVATRFGSRCAR